MARRKTFNAKDRARIFAANGGVCHICRGKIDNTREAFEIEHVIPWALTQDDSDENLRPAHKNCHRRKTDQDVADIARAKRREAKHKGYARPQKRIQSAGFAKEQKQPRIPKKSLPPLKLFEQVRK